MPVPITHKTPTPVLVVALRILVKEIYSEDGVANACIAEAADRIESLDRETSDIALIAHLQGVDAERARWQAKPDWQAILVRYIAHVESEAGSHFVDEDHCEGVFNDKEWEAILQARDQAKTSPS